MSSITLVEAVNLALSRAMEDDDRVVVLGEDVGINGGVFRATAGLQQRFGAERVADTPLAEGLIAGMAVGMAAEGLRPVAEIQFAGFAYTAIDQILNHAGRLRHRTQGRLSCPMVLRTPCGAGIHAPEHHSESPEAMFAHIPGIRVVYPSSPAKAYGLLLASIADPDPVVFLEPSRLYRRFKEEVEDDGEPLPVDQAFIAREGTDVTLVAWGAMLYESLKAADELAGDGHFAEVIDLATLKPIDYDTVLESVKKTGRCVVVSEAPRTASLASEISANISERALLSLLAPVERVTAWDTVTPMFRLEEGYMQNAARIVGGARKVLESKWCASTICPTSARACRKPRSSRGTSGPARRSNRTSRWSRSRPTRRSSRCRRPIAARLRSCSATRATRCTSGRRSSASKAPPPIPAPWSATSRRGRKRRSPPAASRRRWFAARRALK